MQPLSLFEIKNNAAETTSWFNQSRRDFVKNGTKWTLLLLFFWSLTQYACEKADPECFVKATGLERPAWANPNAFDLGEEGKVLLTVDNNGCFGPDVDVTIDQYRVLNSWGAQIINTSVQTLRLNGEDPASNYVGYNIGGVIGGSNSWASYLVVTVTDKGTGEVLSSIQLNP